MASNASQSPFCKIVKVSDDHYHMTLDVSRLDGVREACDGPAAPLSFDRSSAALTALWVMLAQEVADRAGSDSMDRGIAGIEARFADPFPGDDVVLYADPSNPKFDEYALISANPSADVRMSRYFVAVLVREIAYAMLDRWCDD